MKYHAYDGEIEMCIRDSDKARYSNSLSSKLTAHLQRINRTDLIPYIQYDTKHGKGDVYKRQGVYKESQSLIRLCHGNCITF